MTRRNFFLMITSYHNVSIKRFFENKNIGVRFFIMIPPAMPAKQKKQVAIKNSLRLHTRGRPAACKEAV